MNKVLIIDDEALIRDSVAELLELNCFQVIKASDAEKGLLLAHEESPDLILVDILMPGMDGISFVKCLRVNPGFCRTPIIFLSSKSSIEDFRSGMNAGADDYLAKPFSSEDLLETIRLRLDKVRHSNKRNDPWSLSVHKVYFKATHEVNTSLHGILASISIMEDFHDDFDKTDREKLLESMRISAYRLRNIFENNKWVSRIREENLELPQRYFSGLTEIKSLFESSLPMQFPKLIWDKIDINLQEGSTTLIKEVAEKLLLELLSNALKFGKEDSVVKVKGWKSTEGFKVSIENEGSLIQIDPLEIKHAYFQPEREVKEQQGMGIGLFIVLYLCKFLNIPLAINHLKNGNEFILTLPMGTI